MSKFSMTGALVMGALAGLASAGQGGELSQSVQGEGTAMVQMAPAAQDHFDTISFASLTKAIEVRDYWRGQGYAANVINAAGGRYAVRVFNK